MYPPTDQQGMGAPEPANRPSEHCPVVAIGASAGGLELFQRFLSRMRPDTGVSVVLLQHLDPRHETLMPELLARFTSMPVLKAQAGMSLDPNCVYVASPNASLLVQGCTFTSGPLAKTRGDSSLIDDFFRSVAESQSDGVVAILLSGTGSDGTVGMRAVKQHGGVTMAQAPETARFESMPASAMAAGVVDYVLTVEEMPDRVVEYIEHLTRLRESRKQEESRVLTEAVAKVFPILRERTGHDFSRYKQSTLLRRIHRRMQVTYTKSISEYVPLLERSDVEKDNLFKDLLIGVTQFFRDEEAFEKLRREILPAILRDKLNESQVRIWVPGCATGEEAYSIAMLLAETMRESGIPRRAQIFATDLDTHALSVARKGRYPETIAEQMSPDRLQQFFTWTDHHYELCEEVREMCVFSPHNLIKDPPFSRLDLVSCRNVLIYLEAEVQKQLLPLFHHALNPSGYLFLGPSENVATRSEMFRPVDQKNRIFQRKPTLLRTASAVPVIDIGPVTRPITTGPLPLTAPKEHSLARTIERVVMEGYAPPSVIINEQGDVVYFSGRTGKYLEPAVGAPSNKLLDLARKPIRLDLRKAVHRALRDQKEVVRENVTVNFDNVAQQLNLVVRPLTELGKEAGLYVVIFQELTTPHPAPPPGSLVPERELDGPVLQQLEHELRTTKEDLQTTIEELETSNEELKSANEELLSMNEELQSTNEELQTSKEEIQSINDELQRKVDELDATNAVLQNLFQSTNIATVFVDLDLRITRFTPAMYTVTRLGEREIGRPLIEAAPELAGSGVLEDMQEVLHTLTPHEREMCLGGGQQWFLRRILPYRSVTQNVEGLVLTFSDVTELKRAEAERAQLAAIVEGSHDAIIGHAPDGTITSWNAAAEQTFGYSHAEMIGRPIASIIPAERAHELPAVYSKLLRGESVARFDSQCLAKGGRLIDVSVTISPIRDMHGRVAGFSSISRDITQLLRAAEQQARLAAIVEGSDDAIVSKTLEGVITSWNRGAERIFGYTPEEVIGKPINIIIPADRQHEEPHILEQIRRGEQVDHFETVRQRKDGKLIDVSVTISPVRDASGRIIGASKIGRDITDQKHAERAILEAKENLEKQVAQRTAHLDETVRSLEGVCYTMAHDLRSPLRALQGFAQILLADYADRLGEEGKLYAQRIVTGTSRMDILIRDLLEFARLGHVELPSAPVNLIYELERVIEHLDPEIRARDASVTLTGGFPHPVLANVTILHQIFANVIANALKFVGPGVKPKILIAAERHGQFARVSVQDNGIGIAPEHLSRVFGLFQRLHTAEKYPGTGVGLAIVKRGVERMSGHVSITSAPGEGSSVVIDLPLAPA